MSDNTIDELKASLLKSNWPKCNNLASEIGAHKTQEAKMALIEALNKGERHHIRTAAIKSLKNFYDADVIEELKKRLDDSAYEPRIEAKNALKELTGNDFKTAKDE